MARVIADNAARGRICPGIVADRKMWRRRLWIAEEVYKFPRTVTYGAAHTYAHARHRNVS